MKKNRKRESRVKSFYNISSKSSCNRSKHSERKTISTYYYSVYPWIEETYISNNFDFFKAIYCEKYMRKRMQYNKREYLQSNDVIFNILS